MAKVRRVPVTEQQPGDLTARDVLSEDGRILLSTGVRLTRTYIDHLAQHGVEAVYLPDTAPPRPPVASTSCASTTPETPSADRRLQTLK